MCDKCYVESLSVPTYPATSSCRHRHRYARAVIVFQRVPCSPERISAILQGSHVNATVTVNMWSSRVGATHPANTSNARTRHCLPIACMPVPGGHGKE